MDLNAAGVIGGAAVVMFNTGAFAGIVIILYQLTSIR